MWNTIKALTESLMTRLRSLAAQGRGRADGAARRPVVPAGEDPTQTPDHGPQTVQTLASAARPEKETP